MEETKVNNILKELKQVLTKEVKKNKIEEKLLKEIDDIINGIEDPIERERMILFQNDIQDKIKKAKQKKTFI
jgi:hypothetical protein